MEAPSWQSIRLEARLKSGLVLSDATGFVTVGSSGQPVLITNRHVVTGRDNFTDQPLHSTCALPEEVVLHHHTQPLGGWTTMIQPLFEPDGSPAWQEHPNLGPRADFVALPIACPAGISIFAYDVASNADIHIGPTSIVTVIGFPFGHSGAGEAPGFPVWATGFVASEPTENFKSFPVFLVDCRSRPGQSGSPVIAYRRGGTINTTRGDTALSAETVWRFLGVYSGRMHPDSDLGMVWKLSALKELLQTM